MKKILIAVVAFIPSLIWAEEPVLTQAPKTPNLSEFSEAFGHLMGKKLKSLGVKFETVKVIQGLQDSLEGRESPMSVRECIDTFMVLQEEYLEKVAVENLRKAEEFLEKNKTTPGVKVLEHGKLQYRIEQEGKRPIVTEKSAPLIRYKAKFLDGDPVNLPKEEERIDLSEQELIPCFKQAIIGMKENEKRTVFAHPDLAFKTQGITHANSLVIFEIEIIKAHVEKAGQGDVN